MKRLMFSSKLSGSDYSLFKVLTRVANDLKGYSNLDIEISDDVRGITFEDRNGNPVSLRLHKTLVPKYTVINEFQEEISKPLEIDELEYALADIIAKDYR